MKKFSLVLAYTFTLIYVLFAYWQWNDPDPILWIPIYLIPAYVSFRISQGHVNVELLWVLLIISSVAGLQTWMQMTAWEGFMNEGLHMKTINQELAREAVGLWIISLGMAGHLLFKRK